MTTLLGSTTPRLYTPPLVTGPAGPCGCGCALTPDTSFGFGFADFATRIGRPLDPWQRWLAIHAGELLPDGRPRFRQVLVLVARQNGKTELLVILSLWWLFEAHVELVLGTSTKIDYARESWEKAIRLAAKCDELDARIPGRGGIRRANGEQTLTTDDGCRYKIAASNEEGGRSLTVHRLIEDELRQHHDWSAHSAAEDAMNAVKDGQAWAISNQGDHRSVVLTSLRTDALAYIEHGEGDSRLGLFEWSAREGTICADPEALAAANPSLGTRMDLDALLPKARRADDAGGEQEARFRTEVLCQAVAVLTDVKIKASDWARCQGEPDGPGMLDPVVFAVAVAWDSSASAIGVAGHCEDEMRQVELVEYGRGTRWVPAKVEVLLRRWPDATVVLVPSTPAGALVESLEAEGIEVTAITAAEYVTSCANFARAVGEDPATVRHLGGALLNGAASSATARGRGDGNWIWWQSDSAGDISPLVAVTIAHGQLGDTIDPLSNIY